MKRLFLLGIVIVQKNNERNLRQYVKRIAE